GLGPWRRRRWATCEQQGAWLPWTSRALDPGAWASLATYESAGDRLGEPVCRGKGTANRNLSLPGGVQGGNLSKIRAGALPLLAPNDIAKHEKRERRREI